MNKTAHTLKISRQLKHPPTRVFSALTDPVKMGQWFFGMKSGSSQVKNDFRVGGKYSIKMRNSEVDCAPHGRYLEIEAPTKLVFSWLSDDSLGETKVTIELFENDEGTKLVLTHELPLKAIPPHREGWSHCLANLKAFLAASN